MRMRFIYMLGISAFMAAHTAAAHAKLLATTPAAGASLASAPTSLLLRFNEGVRLAVLKLRVGDRTIPITVDIAAAASPVVSIALPPLGAGVYEVRWSAVTPSDGHVVKGSYSFVIR